MWKSLSPLLLTLYFSGVPSVAMTRGTPDTSLAPADSLSQAQLEGGQRKGAQLEGGQLETVTVSATPFRGSLGTTTGSLSYLSTEQLRAGMRNLGNSHYAAMLLVNAPSFGNQPARYYYPGEPRNFYLGLRYQW